MTQERSESAGQEPTREESPFDPNATVGPEMFEEVDFWGGLSPENRAKLLRIAREIVDNRMRPQAYTEDTRGVDGFER